MVVRDTNEVQFSRVDQVSTVLLGRLPTKPPLYEVTASGLGHSNSHTAAQAGYARIEDKIRTLPHRQPVYLH